MIRRNKKLPGATTAARPMLSIWIALLAVFIVELLFYTWCRVQSTQTGYAISNALRIQRHQVELRQELQTEMAHLNSPAYIESEARRLGMMLPTPEQIVTLR
jgi:hypothetical protein